MRIGCTLHAPRSSTRQRPLLLKPDLGCGRLSTDDRIEQPRRGTTPCSTSRRQSVPRESPPARQSGEAQAGHRHRSPEHEQRSTISSSPLLKITPFGGSYKARASELFSHRRFPSSQEIPHLDRREEELRARVLELTIAATSSTRAPGWDW